MSYGDFTGTNALDLALLYIALITNSTTYGTAPRTFTIYVKTGNYTCAASITLPSHVSVALIGDSPVGSDVAGHPYNPGQPTAFVPYININIPTPFGISTWITQTVSSATDPYGSIVLRNVYVNYGGATGCIIGSSSLQAEGCYFLGITFTIIPSLSRANTGGVAHGLVSGHPQALYLKNCVVETWTESAFSLYPLPVGSNDAASWSIDKVVFEDCYLMNAGNQAFGLVLFDVRSVTPAATNPYNVRLIAFRNCKYITQASAVSNSFRATAGLLCVGAGYVSSYMLAPTIEKVEITGCTFLGQGAGTTGSPIFLHWTEVNYSTGTNWATTNPRIIVNKWDVRDNDFIVEPAPNATISPLFLMGNEVYMEGNTFRYKSGGQSQTGQQSTTPFAWLSPLQASYSGQTLNVSPSGFLAVVAYTFSIKRAVFDGMPVNTTDPIVSFTPLTAYVSSKPSISSTWEKVTFNIGRWAQEGVTGAVGSNSGGAPTTYVSLNGEPVSAGSAPGYTYVDNMSVSLTMPSSGSGVCPFMQAVLGCNFISFNNGGASPNSYIKNVSNNGWMDAGTTTTSTPFFHFSGAVPGADQTLCLLFENLTLSGSPALSLQLNADYGMIMRNCSFYNSPTSFISYAFLGTSAILYEQVFEDCRFSFCQGVAIDQSNATISGGAVATNLYQLGYTKWVFRDNSFHNVNLATSSGDYYAVKLTSVLDEKQTMFSLHGNDGTYTSSVYGSESSLQPIFQVSVYRSAGYRSIEDPTTTPKYIFRALGFEDRFPTIDTATGAQFGYRNIDIGSSVWYMLHNNLRFQTIAWS